MPNVAIKEVEVFAAWNRAGTGSNFKNRNHEEYEWEKEEYIIRETEAENALF